MYVKEGVWLSSCICMRTDRLHNLGFFLLLFFPLPSIMQTGADGPALAGAAGAAGPGAKLHHLADRHPDGTPQRT